MIVVDSNVGGVKVEFLAGYTTRVTSPHMLQKVRCTNRSELQDSNQMTYDPTAARSFLPFESFALVPDF